MTGATYCTPGSTRAFGFDTPSKEGASCGSLLGRLGDATTLGVRMQLLCRNEILQERLSSVIPGEKEYHFRHALMRDAASNDKAEVWNVAGGVLKRAAVQLGERDPRTGDFAIASGLKSGDQVLRYPSAALKDGQKVETATAAKAAPVAGSSAPAVKSASK